MSVIGEKSFVDTQQRTHVFTTIEHGGGTTTYLTDSTAQSVSVVENSASAENAPTATLSAGSGGEKTVTVSGGLPSKVTVLSVHQGKRFGVNTDQQGSSNG
jgi:hypothetical protein